MFEGGENHLSSSLSVNLDKNLPTHPFDDAIVY